MALRLLVVLCLSLTQAGTSEEDPEDFPEFPARSVVPPIFPARGQQYTYTLETIVAIVGVLYLLVYFLGKRRNDRLAVSWLHSVRPLFEANFSHVGVAEKPDGPLMQQEANHCYKFFASGRVNCAYALLTLEMRKRQDLLSSSLMQLVMPERDKMIAEIPIRPVESLPLVFAVCRKTAAKTFRLNSEDLKSLTAVRKYDELSPSYCVLAENDETVRALLTSKVLTVLHSLPPSCIDNFLISDQRQLHAGYPLTLRCECYLPTDPKDYGEMTKLCGMLLTLVDCVAGLRLSPTAKLASEKERQILLEAKMKEQKAAREEELQKKKAEQKKKEEEKLQSLSKDKQRKLEEKEYRQSLKKKTAKTKMIKA